ncbi:chemerin-like receptor 1 [Engystomops pustulosus]|uniref:chemerin-like receptor 1 n=1 Tax=Engystomops pustulosus TaxID=76066 RepID=UPI003AFA2684
MENSTFTAYEFTPTTNYETGEDAEKIYRFVQIFSIVVFSITFILGITGNGMVLWIAGFKMKKTVNIIWFLNLAVADFGFDALFPLEITEWIMDEHWPFGQTMCKVMYTVLFLNMSVSTSFLMIISVDRCLLIMFPVWSKQHRSHKTAWTISAVVWLTCFMLSSPYLAFFNIAHDITGNATYCIAFYSHDYDTYNMRYTTMLMVRFVSMFLIPFSIIVVCYSLILFRLRRIRSLSRKNRPLKVIVTIVLCFFGFWFPYHIWPLLEVMDVEVNPTVDYVMFHLVNCIGFFNSCVNPMVYVFAGRDFKKTLFKSIPSYLENTLKEKEISDTEHQFDQVAMETEMEAYSL